MSRSEAISAFGYDAEDVDREIAADNQRADDLGLDLRLRPAPRQTPQPSTAAAMNGNHGAVPQDQHRTTMPDPVHLASRHLAGRRSAWRSVPNST